jgi:arylsulfatase A-like enzyme
MLLRVFSTLQRIGAYANSRIVVVGDHGRSGVAVNSALFESLGIDDGEPTRELEYVMSGGLPLFLAKPAHATGPMTTSHAPVALADVAPTLVAGEPGQARRFSGYAIFEDVIPADRTREFFYYQWADLGWNATYLDPMTVFTVDGHAWLRSSWQAGRTIRRGDTPAPQAPR